MVTSLSTPSVTSPRPSCRAHKSYRLLPSIGPATPYQGRRTWPYRPILWYVSSSMGDVDHGQMECRRCWIRDWSEKRRHSEPYNCLWPWDFWNCSRSQSVSLRCPSYEKLAEKFFQSTCFTTGALHRELGIRISFSYATPVNEYVTVRRECSGSKWLNIFTQISFLGMGLGWYTNNGRTAEHIAFLWTCPRRRTTNTTTSRRNTVFSQYRATGGFCPRMATTWQSNELEAFSDRCVRQCMILLCVYQPAAAI